MKKFSLLLVLISSMIFISCATASYANQRRVKEMDEISYVLANHYPQLYTYYMEGVLDVDSMKEVVLEDGTVDYKVKYHFMKYYYRNHSEMMEVLKNHFPELYQMYLNGVIDITGIYKYVDKDTGVIRNHVLYRRIYDFYYERTIIPYSHTKLYYRPRPMPLPRYRPTPPPPKPQPGPRPSENHRPNGNQHRGGRR